MEYDKAVLIAGPTASGKSALALALAQKTGGVVINADSMQVYRDLRVLTARPTLEEEAAVPHRLAESTIMLGLPTLWAAQGVFAGMGIWT